LQLVDRVDIKSSVTNCISLKALNVGDKFDSHLSAVFRDAPVLPQIFSLFSGATMSVMGS
jgi:hypothetical protein